MCISKKEDGVQLSVYVQPRASKNAVSGLHDDRIKVRLTSPPVDGAANELLIKFLSKKLSVAKSDISIKSGEKSRSKVLFVKGISESEARTKLELS